MQFSEVKKGVLTLLADGEFHSGNELSAKLKVSRTAIWKQINALSDLGIAYTAVSGKGYRLDRPIELFNRKTIELTLTKTSRKLISSLDIHDQINSTSSYLSEQPQHTSVSGMVCLAEYQTAGKGRRGRQWVSPFGSNIYVSLLWRFQSGLAAVSGLSLAAGVATIRALNKCNVYEVGLKWPNDIYWRGKKLGGILAEVSGETEGPCSVVLGIGVNIFLAAKEAKSITQEWVDLSQIMAQDLPSRNALAASVINELLSVIAQYDVFGIENYVDEWRRYDCMQGKNVTMHIGGRQISGIVQGIDDKGMLLLQHADRKVQVYASGEVSFSPSAC